MSQNSRQVVFDKLMPYEQNLLKQITSKREKLQSLNKQSNEIHTDIKNAQSLLTLYMRERHESKGLVANAEVIYVPKGTKHKIVSPGIYFDSDNNCMMANLEPSPRKGPFSNAFVEDLKIFKKNKLSKKRKK